MVEKREDCPCCHLPTLEERAVYDICVVCWWEDDGQDDENADVVFGGPNGEYSLTEARRNYAHHGHMRAEGEGVSVVEDPSDARRELMEYLAALRRDKRELDPEEFERLLRETERSL
jgi:hypothetical protein